MSRFLWFTVYGVECLPGSTVYVIGMFLFFFFLEMVECLASDVGSNSSSV